MELAAQTPSPTEGADDDPLPILIVDDDLPVAESLVDFLEDEGYRAVTAGDGRAALDRLRGGLRPCVILLDLMMPTMNGWDFRKEQLNDDALKDIPIIILTAAAVSEASVQAQLGDVDVVRKPPSLSGLLAAIRRHCGESV